MLEISKYIVCPKCKGDIVASPEGVKCTVCHSLYESRNTIPVLVDLDHVPKHLADQIQYFEHESIIETDYQLLSWQQAYVERFFSHFPEVSGRIIMDCGAGSGYMTIELAKKGALVIACDLTMKTLMRLKRIAEKQGVADRIVLVCCSAESLPVREGVIDHFISNAVLEHLPREKEAIQEIVRVSNANASLMITVPLSYKYLNPLLIPINALHDKRIGHLRRYNQEVLAEKFSGYKLFATYYTGHTAKVLKVLMNLLFPVFNEDRIERFDRIQEKERYWASNIICFMRKG